MAAKFCEEVHIHGGLLCSTDNVPLDLGFLEAQRFRIDCVTLLPIGVALNNNAGDTGPKQGYVVYCDATGTTGTAIGAVAPAAGYYINDGSSTSASSWKRLSYDTEVVLHASKHVSRSGGGYTLGADPIPLDTLVPAADVSMSNNSGTKFKIKNLAAPVLDSDAATKEYVDASRAGLSVKEPVRVATTVALGCSTYSANILTANLNGAIVIDGIGLSVGDRILVKNGATTTTPPIGTASNVYNGIYTVEVVGTGSTPFQIKRAMDFDGTNIATTGEVKTGTYTWVNEGTTNGKSRYVVSTLGTINVGVTLIDWTKDFQAIDLIAGNGIAVSGNTVSTKIGDGLKFDAENKMAVKPNGNTIGVSTDGIKVEACVGMFADNGAGVGLTLAPLYNTATVKLTLGALTAGVVTTITHGMKMPNTTTEVLTDVAPDEIRFYDLNRNQIWFETSDVTTTSFKVKSTIAISANTVYAILTKVGTAS